MHNSRRWLYQALEGQKSKNKKWTSFINHFLSILVSVNVIAVIIESEHSIYVIYEPLFWGFEVFSVLMFTIEYGLRLWTCVESENGRYHHPLFGRWRYLFSPLAIIDFLAILPFYLSFFFGVADLRILRSLRLLRVLKLTRYSHSLELLLAVLRQEAETLISAMFILCFLIILSATGIYLVEGHIQPDKFGSIPRALWWSTVTVATVGYGDVVPITHLGKFFSGLIILTGITVAALPAGILASGIINELKRRREIFRTEMLRALEDGQLDFSDLRYLEKLRSKIGVSRTEARLVFEDAKQEVCLRRYVHCPCCAHALIVQHVHGHITILPDNQVH